MQQIEHAHYGAIDLESHFAGDGLLIRSPINRDSWMILVEQIAEIEELIGEIHDAAEEDDIETAQTLTALSGILRQKRQLLKLIDVG
jgi:hypothetical protein